MHSHGSFYSTVNPWPVLSVLLLRCHANMCRLWRDLIWSGCLALGCLYNLIPYGQFRDHRDFLVIVVSKIWFLGIAVMILLIISFFFLLLLLKKCYVMLSLTTNRQCLFLNVCLSRRVRERNTCHDSLCVNNNYSWGDVTKKQRSKLCGCKQEMCFIK